MKRALVCGVGGQDGAYLAKLLLEKGYRVTGTSRDSAAAQFGNLEELGIRGDVDTISMAINDFRSVLSAIKRVQPDEIYNLAGQSSVGLSFDQPVETIDSIISGTLNLLEAIRFSERPIRLYSAGSSECFGDTGQTPADENFPFRPRSPYAVAKASSHGLVANYREAYNIYACTGILFNHESPLRPARFVTQKIVYGAARISAGLAERLTLGNLEIHRDWGWAPEYVDAMWKMLQLEGPQDFVIATGRTIALREFVALAFAHYNLSWKDHVDTSPDLLRPSDIGYGSANPTKAREILGWSSHVSIEQIVASMCEAASSTLSRQRHP